MTRGGAYLLVRVARNAAQMISRRRLAGGTQVARERRGLARVGCPMTRACARVFRVARRTAGAPGPRSRRMPGRAGNAPMKPQVDLLLRLATFITHRRAWRAKLDQPGLETGSGTACRCTDTRLGTWLRARGAFDPVSSASGIGK